MKIFTYWWGIHLVAEDEEEVKLLAELYKKLENPSEKEVYEEGEVTLYIPYTITTRDHTDFSYKIEDGDVVLEISR